jgi:hypothetical protein
MTGLLTLAVVLSTALWTGLMIGTQVTAEPVTTLEAKIASLETLDFWFYLNYANAALITLLTVATLAGFYLYCRDDHAFWSTIGFAFVPIYGMGNLVAYLSQVFVVPGLLELHRAPETTAIAQTLLGLTIQDWPGSAIAALNGLSYAVLGIPSIIFATLMFRKARGLRAGSALLALSGALSIVALIGVAIENPSLSALTLVSGFIYLLALLLISRFFLRQPTTEAACPPTPADQAMG